MKTKYKYNIEDFDPSETQNHLRLAGRHREKYKAAMRKKAHRPRDAMGIGVEPIGNQEMEDIEKREYGFDFEKSKGLHPDEYCPGG